MLRLLLSKAKEAKFLEKSSKRCHIGIHWIALAIKKIVKRKIFAVFNFAQIFNLPSRLNAKNCKNSIFYKFRVVDKGYFGQ